MKTKKCPECGAAFPANAKRSQVFCAPSCKTIFHNRAKARGQAIVPLALAWRASRGRKGSVGPAALQELSRLLDQYVAEDAKAGRQSPVAFLQRQHAQQIARA